MSQIRRDNLTFTFIRYLEYFPNKNISKLNGANCPFDNSGAFDFIDIEGPREGSMLQYKAT